MAGGSPLRRYPSLTHRVLAALGEEEGLVDGARRVQVNLLVVRGLHGHGAVEDLESRRREATGSVKCRSIAPLYRAGTTRCPTHVHVTDEVKDGLDGVLHSLLLALDHNGPGVQACMGVVRQCQRRTVTVRRRGRRAAQAEAPYPPEPRGGMLTLAPVSCSSCRRAEPPGPVGRGKSGWRRVKGRKGSMAGGAGPAPPKRPTNEPASLWRRAGSGSAGRLAHQ